MKIGLCWKFSRRNQEVGGEGVCVHVYVHVSAYNYRSKGGERVRGRRGILGEYMYVLDLL